MAEPLGPGRGAGAPSTQSLRRLLPPPPPPPPSFFKRALAALAPWALLVLAAMPFAAAYRATFWGAGKPPLHWGRPSLLALLGAVALLGAWLFHVAPRRAPAMVFSRTRDLRRTSQGMVRHLARAPQVTRVLALALAAVALARPQHESGDVVELEGIDIVVALDVSGSMSERDMQPQQAGARGDPVRGGKPEAGADRLGVAKDVLRRFIEKRKSDRIGLVIFGKEAFTQCPLTLDYHALTSLLADVRLDLIDGRGTAIGNAIATALNRLRKSDARSKVLILLTDGDNNAGNVSPQQAARFAQALGVRIFTVLIGRDVDADPANPYVRPRYPVNPRLLEEIAGATGGTPYLATDTLALERRFQAILDELDKTRFKDQKGKPRELYAFFVAPALGLLLLEIGLGLTLFRRWP